jgi:hypothetical protein
MAGTIGKYSRAKLNTIIDQRSKLVSSSVSSGGSADDLGNHTATQDLNLATNSITNVLTGTFASITASGDVHIAGTLYGGSPLKIAGSVQIYDVSGESPQLHSQFGHGVKQRFKHHLGVHITSDSDVTHGITLPNTTTNNSGSVKAYSYETYSSIRFKSNVQTIENPIDKAMQMRGVSFEWKDSGRKDIGLIAEEVAKVIPEVVTFEEGEKYADSMNYQKLVSLLFECVKEQQREIENIKQEMKKMKE